MKLLLVSVLYSIFAVAFGAVNRAVKTEPTYLSEAEASQYCNTLYPVTEDPRERLTAMVINGETIPQANTFGDVEWCHLDCLLNKVGFYAPDGNMRVRSIVKHILNILPELKSNSPNLVMFLFHINRVTKDIEDKCSRSLITYYKFTEAIMIATVTADLDDNPAVKEKVIEAAVNGNRLPTELNNSFKKSFGNVELFYKKTAQLGAKNDSAYRSCRVA